MYFRPLRSWWHYLYIVHTVWALMHECIYMYENIARLPFSPRAFQSVKHATTRVCHSRRIKVRHTTHKWCANAGPSCPIVRVYCLVLTGSNPQQNRKYTSHTLYTSNKSKQVLFSIVSNNNNNYNNNITKKRRASSPQLWVKIPTEVVNVQEIQ